MLEIMFLRNPLFCIESFGQSRKINFINYMTDLSCEEVLSFQSFQAFPKQSSSSLVQRETWCVRVVSSLVSRTLFVKTKTNNPNPTLDHHHQPQTMASLALLTTTIILLGSTDASVIFGRKVRFGRSVHNRDVSSPLLTRMRSAGAKAGEATSTAVTLPSSSSVQGDRLLGKEAADEGTEIITSEVTDDAVNLMLEQSMPMIDVMSLIDMSLSLSMSMPDMPDINFPEPGTGPVLPPMSPEFDLASLFVEALVSVNL